MTAWQYLILAGLLEIGWPIGLKIAQVPEHRWAGFTCALICIILSGFCLWIAQKEIAIGTAYAVWTGIGTAGTFIIGVTVFGEAQQALRWIGVLLIISGVMVLNFGGRSH